MKQVEYIGTHRFMRADVRAMRALVRSGALSMLIWVGRSVSPNEAPHLICGLSLSV